MHFVLVVIAYLIIAAAVLLIIWGLIESCCLKITNDAISDASASQDDSYDLRILYFSDLHREFCFIPSSSVINIIQNEFRSDRGLDAVIFGGDICIGKKTVAKGLKYLSGIADACRELKIPFMAVTGNHDVGAPPYDIGMFPFDNMDNVIKYLKSRKDGRYIAFAGVPDSGRLNRVWALPPEPSAGIDYKAYVLLSHNPDWVLNMPSEAKVHIDAVLSGHIHGGQIRTPFGLEFKLRHDELPRRGIISGLHDINGIKVFISKGIGCVFLPFRIGARPEVNLIELRFGK